MKIAVITGASSGLGREFAVQAARQGEFDEIWVVARRAGRLKELAETLQIPVRPLPLDLQKPESFETLDLLFRSEQAEIGLLVCAAGFGKFGACLDLSDGEISDMIDLNCKAVVRSCRVAVPYMKGGSRIIVMGSSSAFQPLPEFNLYAATKAFVVSFCRALHAELKDRGISVTAVCPGFVRTEFFDVAKDTANPDACNNFKPLYESCDVVRKAYRDAAKSRDMSVYGLHVKLHRLLAKLLPHHAVMRVWMKIK